MGSERRTPLVPLDAGWLFLLPGLALLSSTVLIPAYNDLMDARWSRDRSAMIEQNRLDRVSRYGIYLDALEREDPSVVKSLAASQLNMIPESFEPLAATRDPSNVPATVFPLLEPDPSTVPNMPPARQQSRLEVWATSDRTRVWLIAAGGLCVLVGLLPPAVRSVRERESARRNGAVESPVPAAQPRKRGPHAANRKRSESSDLVATADSPAEPPASHVTNRSTTPAAPAKQADERPEFTRDSSQFAPTGRSDQTALAADPNRGGEVSSDTDATIIRPESPVLLPSSMIEPKPTKPTAASEQGGLTNE